jgi:hypothetical protein
MSTFAFFLEIKVAVKISVGLLYPLWWRITANKKDFTTRTALSKTLK